MQVYEQHLTCLGVQPGFKEERFHCYKRKKTGVVNQQAFQEMYYQAMPAPQYIEPDDMELGILDRSDFQNV